MIRFYVTSNQRSTFLGKFCLLGDGSIWFWKDFKQRWYFSLWGKQICCNLLTFFCRFEPTVFCNLGAFYRIWQTILCIFERKIFSIVRTVGILIHIKKDTSNTIWIFWHHLTSILYGTPLIMIPNSERSDIGNRIFGYNYQPKKEVKR